MRLVCGLVFTQILGLVKTYEKIVTIALSAWFSYLLLTQKCSSCGGSLRPPEYVRTGAVYRSWVPVAPVSIITNASGKMEIKQ